MSDKLQKLLDYLVDRKNGLDTPMTFQEDEYYDECAAKSRMLEEVIDEVKSLMKDENNDH
jgi:hypothetical protein